MKKMMLVVGVLMMAVLVFGAGNVKLDDSAYATIAGLQTAKDMAGVRAFIATLAIPTEANKVFVAQTLAYCDYVDGVKVANIDAGKALALQYATQVGVTVPAQIQYLNMFSVYFGSDLGFSSGITKADAYAYYKTLITPDDNTKTFGMYLALNCGDTAGAIAIAESRATKDYVFLTRISTEDPAKCFGYAKKGLLAKALSVSEVIEILRIVADLDLSDTAITTAMQIKFLQDVNAKYSRFLITDKPTWEPVIANIRTTLEGYGVK